MSKKNKYTANATVGDRVRLRGRIPVGKLIAHNPTTDWCQIDWDSTTPGPLICHHKELEKLDVNVT
jgi:hypothetical protein